MEFDEFFVAEQQRLLRLCYLLTLDRDRSADLAQEVMLRAWASWSTVGNTDRPAAWTTVVALNKSRNYHRRRRLELRRGPLFVRDDATEIAATSDFVDLRRSLTRLPPRQRQAIVLHYWGGFSVDDCARAMHVSPGSVKQHLSRARIRLRKALDPDPAFEPDPTSAWATGEGG